MGIARWTPAEHAIIRACSISEAMVLLPHRTKIAIKSARKTLRVVGAPNVRWSKVEKRRVRKYCSEPLRKLARRFKNRTMEAVRRQKTVMGLSRPPVPWKTTDLARLEKLYPSTPRSDLLTLFPNRTWVAIREQAEIKGWRRVKRYATVANELRAAVQARAREDGISLAKLGVQTRCGEHFLEARSKTVDLNKIARAVEFFGGKLVIDWQDE